MIFAPVSTTPERLHTIRGTQAAWRNALATAHKYPVTTIAAYRIASQAESELRDLWNAA